MLLTYIHARLNEQNIVLCWRDEAGGHDCSRSYFHLNCIAPCLFYICFYYIKRLKEEPFPGSGSVSKSKWLCSRTSVYVPRFSELIKFWISKLSISISVHDIKTPCMWNCNFFFAANLGYLLRTIECYIYYKETVFDDFDRKSICRILLCDESLYCSREIWSGDGKGSRTMWWLADDYHDVYIITRCSFNYDTDVRYNML